MSRLEERLRIEPDGTVTVFSGKVEYGQGIRDAFARLVSAELSVAIERVHVVLGDTARVPWDMGTFGSLSIRTDGVVLARAAAFARQQLVARAANRWSLEPASLSTVDGKVRSSDGRTASYAELADPALDGEIPEETPPLQAPAAGGGPAPSARRDARAIVTGAARFVADLRAPGLLYGAVLHPAVFRARLGSVNQSAARAMPGVVAVVREGDFVGIIAERMDQARAAIAALDPAWLPPAPADAVERHVALRRDSGVTEALAGATGVFEARYESPPVANASIGTNAALADVRSDHAVVRAATQRPFGVREEVAALLHVPPDRVQVIAERTAGSYGRNNAGDAAVEAVRLSRAVGRPVLVVWSRTDELRASPCRPALRARIRAALGADGRISAWASEITTSPHVYGGTGADLPDTVVAMTSGRNGVPPYRIPEVQVDLHVVPAPFRTGALRSLAAAPNVFAIESAMDELALRAGADPLAFRLRHTDDARLRRVLERVAEESRWENRPRGGGRGFGLACAIYNRTYIAQVVEVAVGNHGNVSFISAFCAADCGTVIDPEGARSQLEGGIVQGASWALLEELEERDGAITAVGWGDYPIATFRDGPRQIAVYFSDDGRTAPTGLGEPGAVPTGAALANAVAAACGARVRTLPLRPERVRARP